MIINLVVATTENGVIGSGGKMPWSMPADLEHFRNVTTLGERNIIIMGRKTYDSIGRPLPGRQNFVVTRNRIKEETDYIRASVFNTLQDALDLALGFELFSKVKHSVHIIGGASMYEQILSTGKVDFIHHTLIHTELEGDTFFHIPSGWVINSEKPYLADKDNPYDYTFRVLTKAQD